ncbi:16S rRNA (adenine(1518)-N(6)/adenine(1519)-N(6))-dimethyltransferase RsmA [Pseudomarimonas arenosa]|uniref:Ribosomal RNA small subunit methyltransferase A n=1 Tax=Pseudomarimonas arenosa TaxID=2774145 RepID=A0AAW3ZDZ7_9GAMM|nr:16S rRNA (adenine(1518)-N(6)/adenine(1519)-N(6))-dimethyltransferase RsmA [Pseudomarimonas arenosa]
MVSLDQHRHKKALGQHFLHERGVVDRIIRSLALRPGERVVEIGPGAGALTFPLLEAHGDLSVIEFDRDLIEPLRAAGATRGKLHIVHADVLTVDLTALAAGTPFRLVGNLPYNISSPILFHVLDHATAVIDMHFMLQKEVVDRMAAAPGGKDYGRLSVMLQAYCEVIPLFVVPPGAFRPPPKVDSAVVRMKPLPADSIAIADRAGFAALVKQAFAQRRKTLRNTLSGRASPAQMEAVGIDPGARAETLSVEQFIALANHLHSTP